MRLLLLLIIASSLPGCRTILLKNKVPDAPVCMGLSMKPETRVMPDLGKLTVMRPNPVCMKEINEPYCGVCTYTISDKTVYVGNDWNHLLEVQGKKKTWDTIVEEGFTVPAETQVAFKAFAINVCKNTGACAQEIDRWRIKLDSLDSVGKSLKKP